MNEPTLSQEFQPRPAGQVFKLQNDWLKLFHFLPSLQTSATIYRSEGTIHCLPGQFPNMQLSSNSAFYSDGFRGISLNLDLWHEAWWYHEERLGKMLPCLEIADENGRGLVKMCYESSEKAQADFKILELLIEQEEDEWSILHLRKANLMNCDFNRHRTQSSQALKHLLSIQSEARRKKLELGLLAPHGNQSTWDNLPAMQMNPSCCWLSFGRGETYFNIQPSSFRRAEVSRSENRSVALFYDENEEIALSIIEPEGAALKSFQAIAQPLSS